MSVIDYAEYDRKVARAMGFTLRYIPAPDTRCEGFNLWMHKGRSVCSEENFMPTQRDGDALWALQYFCEHPPYEEEGAYVTYYHRYTGKGQQFPHEVQIYVHDVFRIDRYGQTFGDAVGQALITAAKVLKETYSDKEESPDEKR